MKSTVKQGLAVVVALALVIVAGKFMSDYYLKATDGEENIVESADETAETQTEVISDAIEIPQTEEAVEEVAEEGSEEADENASDEESEDAENDSDADEANEDAIDSEDKSQEECDEHIDEDGDGICDNCGEAIEEEEEDAGSVYVTANVDEDVDQEAGTRIVLTANVEGYTKTDYTYKWQKSLDQENWEDIVGATGAKYIFTLDESTADYSWRVVLVM